MSRVQLRPVGGYVKSEDWRVWTDARLRWLYGPDHAETRKAMTDADLASWRALGSRRRG